MNELICHLIGDYILQSDWMATEKVKRWWPAIVHGCLYTVPFFIFDLTIIQFLIIAGSHVIIDRFRLARYVCWSKNFMAPKGSNSDFEDCRSTGYPPDRPVWLTTWLLIIADNTMHLLINHLVLIGG